MYKLSQFAKTNPVYVLSWILLFFQISPAAIIRKVDLLPHEAIIQSIGFSPDGSTVGIVALKGWHTFLYIYQEHRIQSITPFPNDVINIHAPCFSSDGSIAIGKAHRGSQEALYIYQEGQLHILPLSPEIQSICPPILSSDGSIAIGEARKKSGEGAFYVYQDRQFRLLRSLGVTNWIYAPQLSEDGSIGIGVAIKDNKETLCLYKNGDMFPLDLPGPISEISAPSLAPNGSVAILKVLEADRAVLYLYYNDQIHPLAITTDVSSIEAPALSWDGSKGVGVARRSKQYTLYVYEQGTLRYLPLPMDVTRLHTPHLSPDGSVGIGVALRKGKNILYTYQNGNVQLLESVSVHYDPHPLHRNFIVSNGRKFLIPAKEKQEGPLTGFYEIIFSGIEELPSLYGTTPTAMQASGDLTKIIGMEQDQAIFWEENKVRPFEFTIESEAEGEAMDTGDDDTTLESCGQAINRNGNLAVIEVARGNSKQVYLWSTETHQATELEPSEKTLKMQAFAIDPAGNLVVGASSGHDATTEACYWDQDGKIHFLLSPPTAAAPQKPTSLFSAAYACAPEGVIIAGEGSLHPSGYHPNVALAWILKSRSPYREYVPIALPSLGENHPSAAYGIADTLTHICGTSGGKPCLWTRKNGEWAVQALSEEMGLAKGITSNGRVVYGTSGQQAFIWTESKGFCTLHSILEAQGIREFRDWQFTDIISVSEDHLALVFRGIRPDRQPTVGRLYLQDPL
jgi:hypothetical protein